MTTREIKAEIAKHVAPVYFLVTGRELTLEALTMMVEDLAVYPLPAVLHAITRCRRELKGYMSLADVLHRIESIDGRPGPDEAWSMAIVGYDESETIVQTEEMAMAYNRARPLMVVNDRIAARKAFIETYQRLVQEARQARKPVKWQPSLGTDKDRRAVVLDAAVACGKLSQGQVAGLLPAPTHLSETCNKILRLAASNGELVGDREARFAKAREELTKIKAMLDGKPPGRANEQAN